MFLVILLIYFIILIFLEIIFIISSRYKNKSTELFSIIEKKNVSKPINKSTDKDSGKDSNKETDKNTDTKLDKEIDEEINEEIDEEMKLEISKDDIDIKNYIGKLYIKNYYGFFTNLDTWNLIKSNKIYKFNVPVNIKILKLREKDDIKYYINK